ncbi:MAG: HlyC/CorC family transporter, partial [Deltaproteobacteria bacterium]|nr:HlyC/CorC family transporter [Deltaproteobacteria bacterium]
MISLFALLIFLLICSAFFSGSETALFSLSRVHVHKLRDSKSLSSKRLVEALKKPRQTIVTILLGNEFVNISISVVGAAIINKLMRASVESETLVAVATVTPLVLIFGEIIPKNLSLRHAGVLSRVMVWPLRVFYHIVSPLRIVLTWFADGVVRIFGGKSSASEAMIREEEYRKLIDMGEKDGAIDEEERDLIHNVFEFTDKVVLDIMTSVERIFSLDVNLPFDRIVEEIKYTQFSRVPFYEDEKSNIIGVLHIRDLLPIYRRQQAGAFVEIKEELNEAIFVGPNTPVENLLKKFQKTHVHMAIVKKDAEVVGMVTMDD